MPTPYGAQVFAGHHSLVTPIDWKLKRAGRCQGDIAKGSPLAGDTY